ncbi:MAG: hypothetical protein OXI51_01670 [Chloroflexota bacterium]|nr:hypothetical protein [Chloroflexota bacterium]MDE2668344.1 hypothetical protein [Chloroflexota bacterium]
MPRWSLRRPSLPRPRRGGWVQPGNLITRAIEREMETGLPPHLPAEPDPVPAPVIAENRDEQSGRRPSSAA